MYKLRIVQKLDKFEVQYKRKSIFSFLNPWEFWANHGSIENAEKHCEFLIQCLKENVIKEYD